MATTRQKSNQKSERGVALLIAIFALFMISVVALALMVMAGTESSLNSNYKSSVQAFYDAKAGVEEARGRMWSGHTNPFGNFVVTSGTMMAANQVRYVINNAAGDNVNPTDMSAGNQYADRQYITEFGVNPPAATATTASVSTQAGINGPLYKWVRITPRTEKSAGVDVDGSGGVLDSTNPLYYDGTQQFLANAIPVGVTPYQVFELTALSVTPSGSQRLVQYAVAPINLNITLPAALTFDGPTPNYNAPNSNPFAMNGNDRSGSNPMPGCSLAAQPAKPAVGVVNNSDVAVAESNIPNDRLSHYLGSIAAPSVGNVSGNLPSTEQTVTSLQALVQSISSVANNTLTGPVNNLTAAQLGSASNPQITVVNGDLNLSGNNTGYGILVVTGNLSFSGGNGWRGIVLVIGQGTLQENGGGNNEFDGAVLVAKTLNAAGQPLATLGTPVLDWSGGGGDGIYYDSCWIANATSGVSYQVLSFKEISQ